ncbi:MAG TPA: Mov34/MPN/PAD-1 family protein [Candidatus Polarisedimenticolia bacterium]|nr:Mov34/MPN/PAD-1 family protein [Candidatus Polarisedimenticolia bacterium]
MAKDKNPDPRANKPAEPVTVRSMSEEDKPVRRKFPGPRGAMSKLRVAITREAYADLVAHAKSSLDKEVCGVMAGEVCEDDEGLFVSVEAMVRGTAASQASTHVTFTQETWNMIYKTLERDFPDLRIVGWYHTHPGFGVEFSDMDLFIQSNFFPGATHLALVTDPLSGDVAICINTAAGIQYLESFWVDGREQKCRVPARSSDKAGEAAAAADATSVSGEQVKALEARVSQLVQALDEMRGFHYRFMLTCGFAFCLALMTAVGYTIYKEMTSHIDPPELASFEPIPVQVGDKTVLLGVGVVKWNVPDELNALLLKEDLLKKQAEEKAKKQAEKTNAEPAGASTNSAPDTKKL